MKNLVCVLVVVVVQICFGIVCGEVDRFNCTDPDDYLTTPQIIARHGYQAESHIVTTEDGYLLTVHRIVASKNGTRGKQPVFLQHGLLGSSADWVDGGNKSLAFFLSDAGYDVWLGNARGNVYSRAHVNLSTSSAAFWNFSWHEMGVYDLPAVVYHISNTTGQGGHILYVGHSMGTTMFFVFSSMKPQVAKNIRMMAALAPVAYMTHIKSPIRYLSPWVNDFEFIVKHLGIKEFFPSNKIIRLLSRDCDRALPKVCENFLFVMCGFDKGEIPEDVLKRAIQRGPAGSSMKTVLHFLQEIHNKGNFQNFDFGPDRNMIIYNQTLPPMYPLKHIQIPAYIMFAANDAAVSPIFLQKYLGINQFLPTNKIKRLLARDCDKTFSVQICDDIIFVMFGYDPEQITDEVMERLICRGKAGASTKTILHYLQEIREDGNFQNFDYGPNGNMIKYNSTSPPFYPLKQIDVPTFLMFADDDMVVSPIFLEKYLGLNEFLPSDKIMKFLARDCDWALPKVVCEDVVFLLCGFDREQISDETLQHIVSHDPAGTSTKTVLHYLQEIHNNGNFQNFDYGPEGNMIKYKQKTPPTYRLKNIRVPTYLMYADNDYLASPTDVKRLSLNLTANIGLYEVPLPNFNHIDFLWGKDAPQLIFKPLLGVLRNSTI